MGNQLHIVSFKVCGKAEERISCFRF